MERFDIFDESALLQRLTQGLKRSGKKTVFLVGSPVSAPAGPDQPGVPAVSGIIDLIREEFAGTSQEDEFDRAQSGPNGNAYQNAFHFLLGRSGQDAVNEIIRRAVWKARKLPLVDNSQANYIPSEATSEDSCKVLDSDLEGWLLTPATEALGRLIANYTDYFGDVVLTTNFDPLIEVAIRKSGAEFYRTVLQRDGDLDQTAASGCHVVHLHGYWHGRDTLHTPRQLLQPRPRLKASLHTLISKKTVVVSGYGGWDDVFTQALMDLVVDDVAKPEIIWTFRDPEPQISQELSELLAPGIDRGRVTLYSGIDCQTFLPALYNEWTSIEPPKIPRATVQPSNRVLAIVSTMRTNEGEPFATDVEEEEPLLLEGGEQDRPPLADFCVGRDQELNELFGSTQTVCFLTGMGGQGKSTLAARYFSDSQKLNAFDLYVWRDCKEESERLETQIIAIIERLSRGNVTGADLANQQIDALVDLLFRLADGRRILFVFDNIDHYVDLENDRLTASAHSLMQACLQKQSSCKFVFTCRPRISYPELQVLSRRIEGLPLQSTIELFAKRKALCTPDEIVEAHSFTEGHAFWLDLLAAQVAKKGLKLPALLSRKTPGDAQLPITTLTSLWETLNEREQIVLRAMAESVRPETEQRLGEFVSTKLRYNKFMSALKSLRSLNLIVIKPKFDSSESDVVELHPIVREFIKRKFPKHERLSFINAIYEIYQRTMGFHKTALARRPALATMQVWTESAELSIEAGKLNDAFSMLEEVSNAFDGSAYRGEFARVARSLFEAVDWNEHASYKNFDSVFQSFLRVLVDLGRSDEIEALFVKFESTMPSKDARYIGYCDLRCHIAWSNGNFEAAIEWGMKGRELARSSNVDTKNSTDHNVALAQRDSGKVDEALEYFLHGRKLTDVVDVDELDENAGGPYYGNIGRCLHFMGQIDPAIICYRKSAILIEKDALHEHAVNQGYIRKWIGELLLMRGDLRSSRLFLEGAIHKWSLTCPKKAEDVVRIIEANSEVLAIQPMLSANNIERYCVAWIYGRETEMNTPG